jgi:dihydrofolate synthase/folylpolyglutamate synthase
MTKLEITKYLDSFINFEAIHNRPKSFFTLDRIKELLKRLGDPQKDLKIIHVAGSKGKGSTCVYIASILKQAGYSVGLYTSPHLYHFRERIRLLKSNKKALTEDLFEDEMSWKDLDNILKKIKPTLESLRNHPTLGQLTYFEVLTAVALFYFKKNRADWVVLETGLGGRLDATNAADGLICVMTPMSLEHRDILGKTLEKITKEKLAIIKPTTKCVVVAPQKKNIEVLMKDYFKKHNVEGVFVRDKDIKYHPKLLGRHQAVNAACAYKVINELNALGYNINLKAVEQGIKKAFWPGRFEILKNKRTYILDGAHNLDSAQALVAAVKEIFPRRKVLLILGMFKDKDHRGVCRALNPIVEKVILTKIQHERSAKLSVEKYFKGKDIFETQNISQALKLANDPLVLITGSLYLVAQARKLLKGHHVSI